MENIRDNFQRPDPDLVAALGEIATANLGDAMNRQGVMHSRIKGVFKGIRMAGPAYTVKNQIRENLMSHYALKHAEPGDVLVIDNGGYLEAAGWGELMTLAARIKGLAGVVVDGGVRDSAVLEAMRFPVFSARITPKGTIKHMPGAINGPVVCGDLPVHPGDILVGDDDGVAVVPLGRAEAVLEQARAIQIKEKGLRERINKGESLFDIFGLGELLPPAG